MRAPDIGRHLASLNLFLESDGKLYVTVAGGDVTEIVKQAASRGVPQDGRWPADMVLSLVAMAENLPRSPAASPASSATVARSRDGGAGDKSDG